MKKTSPLFLDQSKSRLSRFVLLSTLLLLLFISFPYHGFSQFSVFSAKAYNTGIAFTADWSELASNGNTYVVGRARSNAFPTTLGAPYGGNTGDGFVAAFDPAGNIIWSRFIGGSSIEEIFGFKMGNGKIYLAMSGGADLPVTDGSTMTGGIALFILNQATGAIEFGTNIAGAGIPQAPFGGDHIFVDGTDIVVTGRVTTGLGFTTTDGSVINGTNDNFIRRYTASGTLVYSKVIGGTGNEFIGKGVIQGGNVYVLTNSPNNTFPVTDGSNTTMGASGGIVLTCFNAATGAIVFSKYILPINIIGTNYASLAADATGVYISGQTAYDASFPVTVGSPFGGGFGDLFAMKFSLSGSLSYSRYLGGIGNEVYRSRAKLLNGELYITGTTTGTGYPVVNGLNYAGGIDIVLTKLNSSGAIAYSTYYGGATDEQFPVLDVASGEAYIYAQVLPTTGLAFPPTTDGTGSTNAINIFQKTFLTKFTTSGKLCMASMMADNVQSLTGGANAPGNFILGDKLYFPATHTTSNPIRFSTTTPFAAGTVAAIGTTVYDVCPPVPTVTSDNIIPSTQTVCQNGLVQQLKGTDIYLDAATSLPLLYRGGNAAEPQANIYFDYQWQSSSSASGPWTDIANATEKNYSPSPTVVSIYFRRLTKQSECCGAGIISTSAVSSILVNGNIAPTVDAGGAALGILQTCPGSAITIGGSPSATGGTAPYTYAWNNGGGAIANPTVSPLIGSIYNLIVTDANGCQQIDQVIVNVPKANAGADKGNCSGSGVQIGTPLPAGATGISYSWNILSGTPGSLSNTTIAQPIASPTSVTSYELTMTVQKSGGGSCTSLDTVIVTPQASPLTTDFAGPDRVICLGSTTTLGTPAESGFTYIWTPGSYITATTSTATFNPGSVNMPVPNKITYVLSASANGCTFTDNVEVAVIEARAGIDYCGPRLIGEPDRTPNLNETYTWTAVSGTAQFLGATNLAQVPVGASIGSDVTYQLTTTYNLNGVVNTCTDFVIVPVLCAVGCHIGVAAESGCPSYALSGGNVQLRAIPPGDTTLYKYSWSPTAGLSSYNTRSVNLTDNVQRTYTVTITSLLDTTWTCTADTMANNAVWSLPVVNAPSPVNSCPNTSVTIGDPSSNPGLTYLWTGGTGLGNYNTNQTSATASNTQTYYLSVTDNVTGCKATDTVLVNRGKAANAGSNKNLCDNGIVTLGSPAQSGYTYSWSPAASVWQNGTNEFSAMPDAQVAINTTFILTQTETSTGCVSTDTVQVNVSPGIAPFSMSPITYCPSSTALVLGYSDGTTGGIQQVPSGYTYAWSPSSLLVSSTVQNPTLKTPMPASATTFTLVVSNAAGCNQLSTQVLTPNVASVNAGLDKTICLGESTAIGSASNPTSGGEVYSWSPTTDLNNPASNNPIFTPSSAGTYTFTVSKTIAGCTSTDIVIINVQSVNLPAIAPTTICSGASAVIGPISPDPSLSYLWTPSIGLNNPTIANPTANPTSTQSYQLTVTDGLGCQANTTVVVGVQTIPAPTVSVANISACIGDAGLSFTPVVSPSGSYVYQWSPATLLSSSTVANPSVSTAVSGTYVYTLTVTNSVTGCSNSVLDATANITVCLPLGSIGDYVWNDLNGNGLNDEPVTSGINGIKVYLLDANQIIIDSTITSNNGSGNPGYYLFPNLNSSTYFVKFPTTNAGNGLTTQTTLSITDNNSDADANTGISPAIVINTLGAGQDKDNTTIDAGYIPVASIGNYVWNDINKNGLQDNNEVGVAGITVTLYNSSNSIVGSTVTDAMGYYKFENLVPGDYSVGFTPPANYTFTQGAAGSGTDNNNNTNSDASTVTGPNFGHTGLITLSAGEYDSTIDAGIVLPTPNTATVGDYVWFDTNADGIQDANEKGISGVVVTLKDGSGNTIATTITDADGKYIFTNVTPGSNYTVEFGQPIGLIPTSNNGVLLDPLNSDMNPITHNSTSFNVAAGDSIMTIDAGFVQQNSTSASLGDRVWYDANNNGIQDLGETGVADVIVKLYDVSGTTVIATTTTDALGYYVFNNLTAGTYVVGFDPTSLPAGTNFTAQNVGTDSTIDGNENSTTGMTSPIVLNAGDRNMTIDAGIYSPTNTNSIGDYVWYDANKDGVQDIIEASVSGVMVTLYDATGNAIAVTTTDANGHYLFPNLPNGSFSVGFSNLPNGFGFTTQETAQSATGSDANPSTGRTATVTLTGNTNITDLDAGIYPQGNPSQTASLGNKVWYDINNDGIQDPIEPGVPGVTVTLLDAGADGIVGTTDDGPNKSMVTNSLGEYLFTGLPVGNYAIQFSNLPAAYTTSPQNAGGNQANDSNVPTGLGGIATTPVIALGEGEDNLTIDAGINKPNVNSIGNYVWIDANQDGQQGSTTTEPGVSGVMVTLYNADGTKYDSDPSTTGIQPLVTTTDANGYYLFTNLPDGTYGVGFSNLPSGYQYTTQEASNTATGSDANSTTGRTSLVTVSGGQTDLTLDAGIYSTTKAALGNYVWIDANADGIQDANETPIAGVLVTLFNGSGNPVATTITNGNGHYLFPNLDPGTYSVGFTNLPDGMVFTTQETNPSATGSDVNPATGKTSPITLAAGEINLDIDAGVKPKPVGGLGDYVWYDTNKNGLQDPTELGVPGVIATCKDATIGAILATAVTNGNGYYLFPNLDPSIQYTVTFSNLPTGYEFTQSVGTLTDPTNSDANTITGATSAATVIAGTINPNVDAGIFQPYASLGDRVWYDVNQDGVQDPSEVGVASITVMLYDAAGQVVGSTVTDAYGNYLFPNLLPGDYTVKFSLPQGFVFSPSTGTSETDSLNSDVNPITGKSTTVNLSAGEDQRNIDAGIYAPQTSTASVGNFVWNDTNSDGVQDPGEVGISGVTVTLYNNAGDVVATTITDADGFYQFTDVQPGTYTVGVTPPVGFIFSPNNGTVNNPSNSDINPTNGTTSPFIVNAGDNITYVDAGLNAQPAASASLGDKVWYDLNQNGIQELGELGVPGITVILYAANGTTVLDSTTTDGYGNYIFNQLNAGQYVIGFNNLPSSFAFTSTTGADSTTNSDANQLTGKTAVITLSAGDYNMTYDAGIFNTNPSNTNSIGDKVWNDVNQDGIQDTNELGVAGVTVTLYDNNNNIITTTSTDANGNYLFPNLPNGIYTVGFSNLPSGYVFSPTGAGTSSTDSDPNPSNGKTSPVTLTGNTNITDIDAGINQGNLNIGLASLGDKVWYDLNGDGLQDSGELGVEGVTVTLYESDGTTIISTTTTDALGNYIFTGLNSGTYIVGFTDLPIGFTTSPKNADAQGINGESNSDVNIATGQTDPIILGSGEQKMSVDMGLVPPSNTASLGDFVWFDLNNNGLQDTNEPGVQGVTVTLYDALGDIVGVTSTDADGSYSFVGLVPDTYNVGFSNFPIGYNLTTIDANTTGINGASNSDADPITGMSASITLTAGQNNLNVDAGIVSTTVASVGDYVWQDINADGIQDANEPGIGGVIVTLYNNTGTPVASTITNPDGSYIFTNVIPGDYTMGFSNIPTGIVFTTQEIDPNSNTGSNVNPSTGITPTFTVTAGTHNPTIDAGLKPTPNAGLGNYVWLDFNEDGIQDASEPGLAGVLVTLYAADGTTVLATAVTDGNGAYSFTNLDAGTYIVGFSNLPTGATRTKVNGVLNDPDNSDMNLDGKTLPFTLTNGQYNPNIDAGIYFGIPLDVSLGNFVAFVNNCHVILSWNTTSETNSNYFAVLRRAANETSFTEIGKVNAKGNSQTLQNYRYNDINAIRGYYEYKLAIHDIDQKLTFSDIQTATIDCSESDQISIYPNPTVDVVNINIHAEAAGDYLINLMDMNGKIVLSTSVDMDVKVKTVQLNLGSLSSGMYQIQVVNSGITKTYKVNKLK